jgi:hypothetical protein
MASLRAACPVRDRRLILVRYRIILDDFELRSAPMTLSRRPALSVIGGGTILAAVGAGAFAVTRAPANALAPWQAAGGYDDLRMRAPSFALLAPNPHNRQPWIVDLGAAHTVTLYADTGRLLPETDPFSRQITIGLGCFLELMRMAAAEEGHRVELALFPEGDDPAALDARPVARARFVPDPATARDPLFAHVLDRRSLKEPYDTARPVAPATLDALAAATTARTRLEATVDPAEVEALRTLSAEALRIEFETPRTLQESIDLFRIGHRELDANPDGIDFSGPLFETLRLAGLFSREAAAIPGSTSYAAGLDAVMANARTAMGHGWLVSPGNTRADQIAAGADWVRLNLATTSLGLGVQPLSQALQEFPEMAGPYAAVHARLAPEGGTVQMLARIGYGPAVGPSPRWPLDAKLARA